MAALAAGTMTALQGGAQADTVDPRIIGGETASESYSFATALYWDQGGNHRFHCGGELIGSQWVLTAAHCVYDQAESKPYDASLFDVRVGSDDRTSGGSQADVSALYVHPDYWTEPDDRQSDLALLKLDHAVAEEPVALAGEAPEPGSAVRVVGWGLTEPGQTEAQVNLRQLDTTIVPDDRCVVGGVQDLTVGDLCVDDPEHPATGTCSGDSGTPVVQRAGDRWQLVGLDSRSVGNSSGTDNGCGSSPSVTPGVAYHRDWILSTTTAG